MSNQKDASDEIMKMHKWVTGPKLPSTWEIGCTHHSVPSRPGTLILGGGHWWLMLRDEKLE